MGNTLGIVGGGAAGMMAAVTAARQGVKVTLLEGNDRLGRKLLSTGNGKCNLGNERLGLEEYYTDEPELLKRCLERFGTADTIAFFKSVGLMVKSKNGYLYPAGEQAAIVLDALRCEVRELGVNVVTDCKITAIKREHGREQIHVRGSGRDYWFDCVILACGGQAAPKTGSDGSGYRLAEQLGHSLKPVLPALVQLKCREDYFKAVAGVRAEAELSVYWKGECIVRERGELQLTEYGISGISVFQLSRVVNYLLAGEYRCQYKGKAEKGRNVLPGKADVERNALPGKAGKGRNVLPGNADVDRNALTGEVVVEVDFLPDVTLEDLERLEAERALLFGRKTVEEFFTGMLHKKLMLLFIKLAGLKSVDSAAAADKQKLHQVYKLCKQWQVHVTGSNSFEHAQVCAGGVSMNEITNDMESKKAPGVYFAGELLDVDGKCGGYNLQWAWCSGYLAGSAAASALGLQKEEG